MFIGSPGGLEVEREAARDVVASVNQGNSEHWQCQFKLVGWEDTIPGYQRPQSKINEDLDKCDYFIGVLWNHWGSRPSNESAYTSGFEEEYERAKQRIAAGQMQDIALYFKSYDVPTGLKADESFQRVIDFRNKCIEEKSVFFKDFTELDQFKDFVRDKLTEIGWKESAVQHAADKSAGEASHPAGATVEGKTANNQVGGLLGPETQQFISEFLKKPSSWEQTEAFEVARFRLASIAISRSGNDDVTLGNHDANLVFRHRRALSLSQQELGALVDCGVAGFGHQNVPLWFWLLASSEEKNAFSRLALLTISGSPVEKKYAFQILRLASQFPSGDSLYFQPRQLIEIWLLGDATDDAAFNEAILLIAENGSLDDVPLIEECIQKVSEKRRGAVEGAIIHLIARHSAKDAINRTLEKNVPQIRLETADLIFEKSASLKTDTLVRCANVKADSVKTRAVQVLLQRGAIDLHMARELLTDTINEVRYFAAEALHRLGQPVDEATLRKSLTVESSGLIGFGTRSSATSDDALFEK